MSITRWFPARSALMGLAAVGAVAAMPQLAAADPSLNALAGSWGGGGQLRLEDGRTERLTCRANYSPRAGGSAMGMSIRCASQSYKIELRSSIRVSGGRVSGTWEERSFNAAGDLSGRSSNGQLNLAFSGSMAGSMSVNYGGAIQRVSIRSNGAGFSNVSISLSRS